jgi:AcrR family transcriptional regulator
LRSTIRTQLGRDERREMIRQTLSDVVERLLADGVPYSEISVGRLCKEASTSRATFYLYFQDKRDLLFQLAEQSLRSVADTSEFWWHLPPGSGRDELRAAFARTFALYREHAGVLRSLREGAAHDQAMDMRLRAVLEWAIAETTTHLREGVACGAIRPDVDPDAAARWLCWMFERGLYDVAGDIPHDELAPLLDAVTALVWNMLYRGCR